jgi:hypothetical protein
MCALPCTYYVQNTKHKQKWKYKALLLKIRRSWISNIQNTTEFVMKFICQRSKQQQGGLNRTCQAGSSGISEYTNWKEFLLVGREERNILQGDVNLCFT